MRQRVNKWAVYLLIILGVLGLGAYGYIRAGRAQPPRLAVSTSSYDFGKIRPEPVERSFELENKGGELLEINRVSTSCSCTSAEVSDREVEPGDSTLLRVTFDPTAMDPPIRGEVLRVIYVQSNDPAREEAKIEVTAEVLEDE